VSGVSVWRKNVRVWGPGHDQHVVSANIIARFLYALTFPFTDRVHVVPDRIAGQVQNFRFNNGGDKDKLVEVSSWG
jgi:hypothetical protein